MKCTKPGTEERITYLDIAKGISILLVMVSHSCGFPFETGKYFTAFYIQSFFIVSGLTYKRRTVKENVLRRVKGIILPYFMYNIIIVVINIVLGEIENIKLLVETIAGILYSRYCYYPIDYVGVNRYYLSIGNSPLWFLTAMFVSSCIFYILVECINERRIYLYIWSIVLIVLTIILKQLPILLPWSIDTAFMGALFMLIGYYGKNIFIKGMKWKELLIVLLIYLTCSYYNDGINISIRLYGNHGIISILAVCAIGVTGTLLCIWLAKAVVSISLIRNIFTYIGKNTIVLLAFHVTIFRIFDEILGCLNISEDANGIIYYGIGLVRLIVTTGICLGMVWVKKLWIEKYCSIKKGNGIYFGMK